VDDLDRLIRDLDDADEELRRKASVVVRAATLQTEAISKQFVPVDTTFLQSTISPEFGESRDAVWGEVGPTADYGDYVERGTKHSSEDWDLHDEDPAHDVEYGTWRTPPQPYMNPAADIVEPQFYAACEAIEVLGG
jgi:HK97 gp10 family phage protein